MTSKNTLYLLLFIFLSTSLTSLSLSAASVYISDELYVPIRKDKGNKFAILHKGLPSGTKLTLVERDKEWTKVSTAGGITGWIRNQFISNQPPAKLQLASAKAKITSLTEQVDNLNQEKLVITENYQASQSQLNKIESAAKKTEEEFSALKDISSSAVESHQRLQTIAQKMQLLQTENDVLKSENESLRRSENTTFFFYGAIAVLLGVILAIVLPKLKPNKRNTGWIN